MYTYTTIVGASKAGGKHGRQTLIRMSVSFFFKRHFMKKLSWGNEMWCCWYVLNYKVLL